MAEIVNMPKLGFDMKEGVLVRWIKKEGEEVAKGDVLAEIETDKATVEVESAFAGILANQLVEADAVVPIGDPIAVIAEKGEKIDLEALLGKKTETKPSESESPKENEEKSSKPESAKEEEEKSSEKMKTSPSEEIEDDGGRIKASPLAKKIASENKIDLDNVDGTGPGGRIIKKDIEAILESEPEKTTEAVETKRVKEKESSLEKSPDPGIPLPTAGWFADERDIQDIKKPMNKLRQAIARRMTQSKQNVPHFYLTKSMNVESLMSVYKQVNETLPAQQKISINDYVIKATALALLEYPNLNSSITDNEMVQHGNVNIGVAVAVEGGLLTVVVRNADRKPLRVISQEVKDMATRVRSGKVRPEEVDGSTFSISNLGMFDVENFEFWQGTVYLVYIISFLSGSFSSSFLIEKFIL